MPLRVTLLMMAFIRVDTPALVFQRAYVAVAPQSITLECSFMHNSSYSSMAYPMLSKYRSTPLGNTLFRTALTPS